MTEIPFLTNLGDAFDAAITARVPGHSRQRWFAARPALASAAVLTLAVLIVAPAVGVRGHIVRLFADAPHAPQRVEKAFAAFEGGIPPRLRAGVLDGEARQVLAVPVTSNERWILWLAPLSGGGFCTLAELESSDGARRGGGGECEPVMHRLGFETSLRGRVSADGEILSGPVLLYGSVGLAKADSLGVGFEDGRTAAIPLVWVTKPVDTGFFVYSVPPLHWQVGHLPTTLIVRNAEGKEIAHGEVTGIDLRKAFAGLAR